MESLLKDIKEIEKKQKTLLHQTNDSIEQIISRLRNGDDAKEEASKLSEDFKKFYSSYGKLGKSIEKV